MSIPVKLVLSKTCFTSMSCVLSLSGWYGVVLVFCFEEGTHLLKQLGFKSATKPAHYRVHQVWSSLYQPGCTFDQTLQSTGDPWYPVKLSWMGNLESCCWGVFFLTATGTSNVSTFHTVATNLKHHVSGHTSKSILVMAPRSCLLQGDQVTTLCEGYFE